MRPHPAHGKIRPRVSSLPRTRSESSAYLEIYKLTVEKERLQQELQMLDQRRTQLVERLTVIEAQAADLDRQANQSGEASSGARAQSKAGFDTLLFEY